MTRPRSYQTEAVIIRKTKLGEADRILTLYTPQLGKIQGVARGVRRPRSKLAGHLELLTHSQVSLARGRNLDTITGAQTSNAFLPLKNDLWLSSYGLYAVEMVNQFTPEHVPNPALFGLLITTLDNLCQEGTDRNLTLRHFELHLLQEVGYRPQLGHCVDCKSQLQPVTNYYSLVTGGTLCPECARSQTNHPISVNALKVMRFLQDHDYQAVRLLRIEPELSRELELIMRNYLRHLLERELKSAGWLDTLRQQVGQTSD